MPSHQKNGLKAILAMTNTQIIAQLGDAQKQINCPGQLISLGLLLIGHQNVYSGMNWWLGLTVPGEIDVGLGEYILGH